MPGKTISKENLNAAQSRRYDEFYTRRVMVENELRHYPPAVFAGKSVYCNCDTPASEFFKYFKDNFHRLGLRKLAATAIRGAAYTYNGHNIAETPLRYNGDFRNPECQEFLAAADYVITNPPFSLIRDWLKLNLDFGKEFLAVAPVYALSYRVMRDPVCRGEAVPGFTLRLTGDTRFIVPDDFPRHKKMEYDEDGRRIVPVGTASWISTMKHRFVPPPLATGTVLADNRYTIADDGYNINFDEVANIPMDYDGPMLVPISFLFKHNPDQFDLLGFNKRVFVDGDWKFCRVFIRKKDDDPAALDD